MTLYKEFESDWNKPQIKHLEYVVDKGSFYTKLGIKVLIYNGDLDLLCNWKGAEKWTKQLKWKG